MKVSANDVELAVLVNSFNRVELFKDGVAALRRWLGKGKSEWSGKTAIVVYEVGSKDGTREWLREVSDTTDLSIVVVTPESPDEDTSFAAGLNRIASESISRFANLKHLLFYETDNQILSAEPVDRALKVLNENDQIGACGFSVRKVGGQAAGVGASFPTAKSFLIGPKLGHYLQTDKNKCHDKSSYGTKGYQYLDIVYTSPLLVKVEAWQKSEGLDAEMFPFSDCDLDWAKRFRDCGYRMAVIYSEEVIHDNQTTLSAWSGKRAIHAHKGRFRYLQRHSPEALKRIHPTGLLGRHYLEKIGANVRYWNDSEKRKRNNAVIDQLIKTCRNGYEE